MLQTQPLWQTRRRPTMNCRQAVTQTWTLAHMKLICARREVIEIKFKVLPHMTLSELALV